ncbi:GAF domain-containing protein [Polymorphospora sp. NPDC050346]|uniref:GAF domain-containing protein n=1 Tax=Polymorphospora sp. NPDC050346 TaxID=3155780 RepID=UPI0033F10FDC
MTERRLLQSIVEVARQVFGAAAASIFFVDPDTGELVFEAVAGEGEHHLLGARFPAGTGVAGWVAASGQPMIIDDVSGLAQFAEDAAESTGYVPRSIMAAPLIRYEECIGVLEVLDPTASRRSELADVDLLALLGTQGACGLELLLRLRRATGAQPQPADAHLLLQRIASWLPVGARTADTPALKLLTVVDELISGRPA